MNKDLSLDDGHGNTFAKCSPDCKMYIVKPNKADCECEFEGYDERREMAEIARKAEAPPKPNYELLIHADPVAFDVLVNNRLDIGYSLHGSTFSVQREKIICRGGSVSMMQIRFCQAVILK